jgi:hypothetical protein
MEVAKEVAKVCLLEEAEEVVVELEVIEEVIVDLQVIVEVIIVEIALVEDNQDRKPIILRTRQIEKINRIRETRWPLFYERAQQGDTCRPVCRRSRRGLHW